MKRITVVGALAGLAVVVALAISFAVSKYTVPAVHASTGCSVATLHGNYGVIQPAGFTTHNSPNGSEVPWQFVGVETFDGNGGTSVNYTAAVNGAIFTELGPDKVSTGTYQVNPDCTGSLLITNGPAAPANFNIVIVGGGAEVFGISTDNGDTGTFDEKKQ